MEHDGYARWKAEQWWRARSHDPFPESAQQVVDMANAEPLATHALLLVHRLCTRVILMDQGLVLADRPTEALLADTTLLSAHGLVD